MATQNLGWVVICDDCNETATPLDLRTGASTYATAAAAIEEAVGRGWTSRREGARPKWRRVERCPECSAKAGLVIDVAVRSEPCAAPDGGTCTCERNEDGQVTSHSLGACPVHAYGAATRAHNARTQHDACTCRRTDDGRGIYPSGTCPVHARTHGGGMAGHD